MTSIIHLFLINPQNACWEIIGNNFFGRFDDLHIIGDTISQDDVLNFIIAYPQVLQDRLHGVMWMLE